MMPTSRLYEGTVVHKRLRPKPHALSYRVFTMLLDVDEIETLSGRTWLFSRNRWNAVSFHDADHGDGSPTPVAVKARATLAAAGLAAAGHRIALLAYPRILGYGFNPISVYYGFEASGRLGAVIYEVNNTFGERRSYVVAVEAGTGSPVGKAQVVHAHGCAKQLYVSPFTDMAGSYAFRLTEPGDNLVLGVSLRDADGPILKTHFRGAAHALSDARLAWLLLTRPLLTLKVTAAIHYEALRLWLKGVPLTTRPPAPVYAVTHVAPLTVPQPAPTRG